MMKQWPTLKEEEAQLQKKRQQLWQGESNNPDESWVPLSSWLLNGVRQYKNITSDSELLKYIQEEDHPPPPETFYTNQQATGEVQAILARHGLTHQLLDEKLQEYRQAMEQGLISAEEWEKCAAELEKIRTQHQERLKKIITWFMDNYYRVFDEKFQVVAKVTLTGTRIWSDDTRQKELREILALPCIPQQKRYRR